MTRVAGRPPGASTQGGAGTVRKALRHAWEMENAARAEQRIRNLARRLDKEWPGIAVTILEGIDETHSPHQPCALSSSPSSRLSPNNLTMPSWLTSMPRKASISSTIRRLNENLKYSQTV